MIAESLETEIQSLSIDVWNSLVCEVFVKPPFYEIQINLSDLLDLGVVAMTENSCQTESNNHIRLLGTGWMRQSVRSNVVYRQAWLLPVEDQCFSSDVRDTQLGQPRLAWYSSTVTCAQRQQPYTMVRIAIDMRLQTTEKQKWSLSRRTWEHAACV